MSFKIVVTNLDDLSEVEIDVEYETALARALRLFAKLIRLVGWLGAQRELVEAAQRESFNASTKRTFTRTIAS